VLLSPVFVIDIVQEVITFLQFVVVLAFLAALLWLFRPAEDSPYLLMGDGIDTLDTGQHPNAVAVACRGLRSA
jgi:hypothetical protein